jgi:hypothetical protein
MLLFYLIERKKRKEKKNAIICYEEKYIGPITMTAQSKAWNIFARSNAGIVGIQIEVCISVCIYSVFMLFCV